MTLLHTPPKYIHAISPYEGMVDIYENLMDRLIAVRQDGAHAVTFSLSPRDRFRVEAYRDYMLNQSRMLREEGLETTLEEQVAESLDLFFKVICHVQRFPSLTAEVQGLLDKIWELNYGTSAG